MLLSQLGPARRELLQLRRRLLPAVRACGVDRCTACEQARREDTRHVNLNAPSLRLDQQREALLIEQIVTARQQRRLHHPRRRPAEQPQVPLHHVGIEGVQAEGRLLDLARLAQLGKPTQQAVVRERLLGPVDRKLLAHLTRDGDAV